MAPIQKILVAGLGLLSMASSVLAVNAGKTGLAVTCQDLSGGVDGKGRTERIAQEVDSTAVDAIIAGIGAVNPNFSCAKARIGNRLNCQSSLQAPDKNAATTEVRALLNAVRNIERTHLAANPPPAAKPASPKPAAGGAGAALPPCARDLDEEEDPDAAPRSLVGLLRRVAKLSFGKKPAAAKPTKPAAAPAAAPPAKPAAAPACKRIVVPVKSGPPTVMAALLARAHIIDA